MILATVALTMLALTLSAAAQSVISAGASDRRDTDVVSFIQLDLPGFLNTTLYKLNDRGEIAGTAFDDGSTIVGHHAFLLARDESTHVDFPGAGGTGAAGINDRGDVVGDFGDAAGIQHGFLLDRDGFTRIDVARATDTVAAGINDRRQIVGAFNERADGVDGVFVFGAGSHGFLLHEEIFRRIDVPDALGTFAAAINKQGQIVGFYLDVGGVQHGFLGDAARGNAFTPIDFPGAGQTGASAINDRGEIVGQFQDSAGAVHGFHLHHGVFTQIDFPGAGLTAPQGINNRRQIVGFFADTAGMLHGFCATVDREHRSGRRPRRSC